MKRPWKTLCVVGKKGKVITFYYKKSGKKTELKREGADVTVLAPAPFLAKNGQMHPMVAFTMLAMLDGRIPDHCCQCAKEKSRGKKTMVAP